MTVNGDMPKGSVGNCGAFFVVYDGSQLLDVVPSAW